MKKQKENSHEGITWSEMGKQNVQAEKVYWNRRSNSFHAKVKQKSAVSLNQALFNLTKDWPSKCWLFYLGNLNLFHSLEKKILCFTVPVGTMTLSTLGSLKILKETQRKGKKKKEAVLEGHWSPLRAVIPTSHCPVVNGCGPQFRPTNKATYQTCEQTSEAICDFKSLFVV